MKRQIRPMLRWALAAVMLPGSAALAQEPIEVWHAAEPGELEALYVAAQRYEERFGAPVTLVEFGSVEELNEQFVVASQGGAAPDLVISDHLAGPRFVEGGLVNGLCLPDGCPSICEQPDPPPLCWVIQGEFNATMIPGFQMDAGRCLEGECGECDPVGGGPVPFYCKYVHGGPEMDVLQSAFARLDEERGQVLPVGVPLGWKYAAVAFNPQKLEEHGLSTPEDSEQTYEAASITGGAYFDIDFCGTPPRPPLPPWWLEDFRQDPRPLDEAAVLVFPSDRVRSVQDALGVSVSMLPLAGNAPRVLVKGAYVSALSEKHDSALGFLVELTSDDLQLGSFEQAGVLPASAAALESAADLGVAEGLVDGGKTGALELPAAY